MNLPSSRVSAWWNIQLGNLPRAKNIQKYVDINIGYFSEHVKASRGKIMFSSSGPHRQVYQVMKTPRLIHFSSVSLRIKVQSAFFRAQFTRQLYIGSWGSSLRRSRSFINIHENEDINDIFSFIRSSRVYSGLKRPSRETTLFRKAANISNSCHKGQTGPFA